LQLRVVEHRTERRAFYRRKRSALVSATAFARGEGARRDCVVSPADADAVQDAQAVAHAILRTHALAHANRKMPLQAERRGQASRDLSLVEQQVALRESRVWCHAECRMLVPHRPPSEQSRTQLNSRASQVIKSIAPPPTLTT